jgi:hypothetical protein
MAKRNREEVLRRAPGAITRRRFIGETAAVAAFAALASRCARALPAIAGTAAPTAATSQIVLFRASDAVKPGQYFSLNGEGLNAANMEVFVASAAYAPGTAPPAQIHRATIVQSDNQGHFAVAQLPPQLAPGIFYAWVQSATSKSNYFPLNQPRPLFLSEFEAWEGQEIEIIGRNFNPAEYGAPGTPRVRLVNTNKEFADAVIVSYNPFAITISIRDIKTAEYSIEVSTDGRTWWPGPAGETLTILPVGKDPLGLGVAWAGHFQWDRIYNVAQLGIPTSGGVNVTARIQSIVNTAAAAGGGVVYFPAGKYQTSQIDLPAGVVLEGAGAEKTFLISIAGASTRLITTVCQAGRHGVANLSIQLKDPRIQPWAFLMLGQQNGTQADITTYTAEDIFVKNVNITCSLLPPPSPLMLGIGLLWMAKQRVLLSGCNFIGHQAVPNINSVSNYFTMKNNYFEFATGNIACIGSRCFYEQNHLVGRREFSAPLENLQGLFARTKVYMANNVVEGMGNLDENDGEGLCVEYPSANFNYGSVTAASDSTLTVLPQVPLANPLVEFGYLAAAIIDGRGLGQLRAVTDIDSANNQIVIADPWDVIPDATSAFTLLLPLEQVTYYANTIKDCYAGMWLYGNGFDSVEADNISINSKGMFLYTVRTPACFVPGYFIRFARNTVVGVSAKSESSFIAYNTARFDQNGAYFGTMAYGVEMIDNSISGVPSAVPVGDTTGSPYPGLVCSAATYSSYYDGNPAGADAKNTLLLRNQLTEMTTAVYLTHSIYGTVVADNTYTSTVKTFLVDTGSVNTLLIGNRKV